MTISPAPPQVAGPTQAGELGTRFATEAVPYMGKLYPAAMRLTRNHCDAEDLIQETFAKAYVKFHQYQPGTNLKAWLYTILLRTFYSTCRRKDRRVGEVLSGEIVDVADTKQAYGGSPRSAEAEAMERLGSSNVMRALGDLPEAYREAIYLSDIEGYRYHEIADIMGTPLGTVMSRVHRGRAILRDKLSAHALGRGAVAKPRAPEAGSEPADLDERRTVSVAGGTAGLSVAA